MKNKAYIIYSLIVPVLYTVMVFLNYRFGVSAADILSRPYGRISDIVTAIIIGTYILLVAGQFVLFFINRQKVNTKYVLMLISNSIWGFLMSVSAFTAWVIFGLVMAFIAGGFLIVIGYFILYVLMIKDLIKIIREENH